MAAAVALSAWWSLMHRDVGYLLGPLAVVGHWVFLFSRPLAVVNAEGISRPWRRPSFVSWVDVESVVPVDPGFRGVRLNLVGGGTVSLSDISTSRTADVAAVGSKVIRLPAASMPAPRSSVRTDVEIEADVRRQAAALAEQRKRLKAQSDALHWKP